MMLLSQRKSTDLSHPVSCYRLHPPLTILYTGSLACCSLRGDCLKAGKCQRISQLSGKCREI